MASSNLAMRTLEARPRGKSGGRGTEKAKVFVALSLDAHGEPRHLKMRVTQNIKRASVKKFAQSCFADGSAIHSDDYRSYIPALKGYAHEYKPYIPMGEWPCHSEQFGSKEFPRFL